MKGNGVQARGAYLVGQCSLSRRGRVVQMGAVRERYHSGGVHQVLHSSLRRCDVFNRQAEHRAAADDSSKARCPCFVLEDMRCLQQTVPVAP